VVVGIDAREGKAAVEGWAETTAVPAEELARRYQGLGVRAIIFTDIARDGMLTGPAVESTRRLMRAVKIPVIASGGVKDIADIRALLPLARKGLEGVITGRAVYEGTLDLAEAIALSKQGLPK
jgi:phosphoribosylformimino-5-aminoimidazole carboxamide ribotide isomerase